LNNDQNYSQPPSTDTRPSRILADVFHEMDKVLCTISKKHTHHNAFATAFSNTLLIPDKNDRLKVEAHLKRKNLVEWAIALHGMYESDFFSKFEKNI